MLRLTCLLALASAVSFVVASYAPDNKHTIFQDAATGITLRYVSNSGICETTPGVKQHSGYADFGNGNSLFWWFFEARKSPTTAPLALWLNGGPGCSSMIGLFQENGPCLFKNESTSSLTSNEYSWNNVANMLYLDQPFRTGYSNGTLAVGTAKSAEKYVWRFLQTFYHAFPYYDNRNFGFFSESYGGHWVPPFVEYFESKNAAIKSGAITGVEIRLVAAGINNGWFDPLIQYKAQIDYAYKNPYRPVIDKKTADNFTTIFNSKCKPALERCSQTDSDLDCSKADQLCGNDVTSPLQDLDFDVYDIRQGSNDSFPLGTFVSYLEEPSVVKAIGVDQNATYRVCAGFVDANFNITGDNARSTVAALNKIVNRDIQVLIWAGTADWICNAEGVEAVVSRLTFPGSHKFNEMKMREYTVNGKVAGKFKTAGKVSYLEVSDAGHEVPAYQPAAALQAFTQTLYQQALYST